MWKVIIVDDENIIRIGLKQYIEECGLPYKVTGTARNAAEAMKLVEQTAPHVMFVDINMAEVNGLDLLRLVKCRYEHIVAVMISGYDHFDYARQALQLQAFDYMLKPVPKSDLKRLLHRLDQHLHSIHSDENIGALKAEEQRNIGEASFGASDGSVVLGKVKAYIESCYYDPDLNVSRVAAMFHMNQTYLSKRMKQELGASYLEFLTELRISKAKEILDSSMHNIKIGDLAVKVGYTNQYYFSRLFKNRVGMSPLEYKNRDAQLQ